MAPTLQAPSAGPFAPGEWSNPDAFANDTPRFADQKKGPPLRVALFFDWWRRRESNPRPQALYSRSYMLSHFFNLPLPLPKDRCDSGSLGLGFSSSGPDNLTLRS